MSTTPDTPEQGHTACPSTSAAWRELLGAVYRDVASLRRGVTQRSRPSGDAGGLAPPARSPLWGIVKVFIVLSLAAIIVFTAAMLLVLRDLPLNGGIPEAREQSIHLEAADGQAIGRVGPLKVSNATRADFPPTLVAAVLSIEDRRFYQHWGIDPFGMARALVRNYSSSRIVEGGSTITQQLVKLRLVGNKRTFGRKLREALTAVWLEMRLGKEEILTLYLNSVYMGAGAQGVPAAAELYFNKRPSELTLPEAALLAGMIRAPTRYNPLHNLAGARTRAAVVLRAMVDAEAISKQVADAAMAYPAVLNAPAVGTNATTWFSDWVSQEARDVTAGLNGTLRVRTTLVPQLQQAAEQVIGDGLRESAARNVSQAALVAMRPDGSVVAMVGGRNYSESQFNRAVQAQRQPGSAFKPFVYLAALRSGRRSEDTVDASSFKIGAWEPENSGHREYGRVTLADAFAHSINTAAVRLAMDVGLDQVILAARDLGISTPIPTVPSMALGSAEVSVLNLTAAYASVLAGHAPIQPWGVASLASDEKSRLMSIGAPTGEQKDLGPAGAQLRDLLRLPVQQGTARAAALDGYAAGKTGTTQDNRDAWFIGFTQSLVVGIWVGNDDRAPMDEVTGGSLPAVLWKSFMLKAAPVPSIAIGAETVAHDVTPTPGQNTGTTTLQCDLRACARKYQSFNAADCTYQPYGGGPRESCSTAAEETAVASPPNSAPRRCNVEACSAAYSSFRAEDCTYLPRDDGSRRACEKEFTIVGRQPNKSAADFEPQRREPKEAGARDYGSLRERLLGF